MCLTGQALVSGADFNWRRIFLLAQARWECREFFTLQRVDDLAME
jgi:hypothetical protein